MLNKMILSYLAISIGVPFPQAYAVETEMQKAKGQSIVVQKMMGRDLISRSGNDLLKARGVLDAQFNPGKDTEMEFLEKNYQYINGKLNELQKSDHLINVGKEGLKGVLKLTGKSGVYEQVGDFIFGKALGINAPLTEYYKAGLVRLINESVEQRYLSRFRGKLDQLAIINIDKKYDLAHFLNAKLDQCMECSPEQKQILRDGTGKALLALIKGIDQDYRTINEELASTTGSFAQKMNELLQINKNVEEFVKKTVSNQDSLIEVQGQINQGLSDLMNLIKTTNPEEAKKQLKFLEDFLYSKTSTGLKLAALDSGSYGTEFKEKKADLINKLVKFNNEAAVYVSLASDMYNAANALGIKLPKGVHQFYEQASRAYTAFSAVTNHLASGNYIGAALSTLGAFSKMKDASAARHEEIMAQLSVINQKLDMVLENQKKIMEMQIRTMEMIQQLSQQMTAQYQDLAQQLHYARIDITTNRIMLLELLRKPLDSCASFLSYMPEEGSDSPFTKINSQLNNSVISNHYMNCMPLTSTLAVIRTNYGDAPFPSLISLRSNAGNTGNGGNDRQQNATYAEIAPQIEDLRNLFNTLKKKDASIVEKIFYLGMVPYTDPVSLRQYHDAWKMSESEFRKMEFGGLERNFEDYLFNPISTTHLLKVADTAAKISPYLDIINKDFKVEVLPGSAHPGKDTLLHTLTYLDITLSQHSLYNGQSLIPFLYENLKDEKTADPELMAAAIKVMKNNEVFKQNFMKYFVANRYFEISGINTFYHINIASNNYVSNLENRNYTFMKPDLRLVKNAEVELSFQTPKDKPVSVTFKVMKENKLVDSIDVELPILKKGDHDIFEISANTYNLSQKRHQIRTLFESYSNDREIEKKLGPESAATWLKMTMMSSK